MGAHVFDAFRSLSWTDGWCQLGLWRQLLARSVRRGLRKVVVVLVGGGGGREEGVYRNNFYNCSAQEIRPFPQQATKMERET